MHDLHIQKDNVDKASKVCWGGFNVLENIVVNSFIFVHVELLPLAVYYQIESLYLVFEVLFKDMRVYKSD